MKRGRHIPIIAGLLVLVGVLLWVGWPHHNGLPRSATLNEGRGNPNPSTPFPHTTTNVAAAVTTNQAEIERRKEQEINAYYLTPIAVYGKVVDENASPISGATVEIGITDSPVKTGSDYVQTTNGEGLFSLTDVRGIAFSVRASKDGYYTTAESRGQRNVIAPSNDDLPQPSKQQPIVLVLRKKGETVPLFFASSRQIDVPRNGQPVTVDLVTGRTGEGALRLTSWLGESKQPRFDWRYQLSIPGGGLIERKGEFDFEAPVDGYRSVTEINMPATAERWSSDVMKNYFAKLPDGRYARFSINLYPGDRNFVVLESYVNPTPGNRNLEFDPKRVVRSP
jgi:Carboxypeptidase regulatory-like domain